MVSVDILNSLLPAVVFSWSMFCALMWRPNHYVFSWFFTPEICLESQRISLSFNWYDTCIVKIGLLKTFQAQSIRWRRNTCVWCLSDITIIIVTNFCRRSVHIKKKEGKKQNGVFVTVNYDFVLTIVKRSANDLYHGNYCRIISLMTTKIVIRGIWYMSF